MKAASTGSTAGPAGFDAAGNEVRADWSTGKVGMIGVSYNGTLPNAVAATGVQGLETIVPIAAISSWYDYYRANGGVVAPGGFQGEDADVLARLVLTRADAGGLRRARWTEIEQRPGPRHRRLQPTSGTSATTSRRGQGAGQRVRWCTASTTGTSRPSSSASGGTRSPRGTCRARSGCTRAPTSTRSPTPAQRRVAAPAAPLVRLLAVRHRQRHHGRAEGGRGDRARPVGPARLVAAAGHP